MRLPPKNRIATNAPKVWRIGNAIVLAVIWLIVIAGLILSNIFDITLWIAGIALVITILLTYLFMFLIPNLRFRRWRYEIHEQEIYIQHGILIEKRVLIPMIRVQHVDTSQGPIAKKYGVASISIYTAATEHEIPALGEEIAADLRDQISLLAKVDVDDV